MTDTDKPQIVKPLEWNINRSSKQVGAVGAFGEIYVTKLGGKWFYKGECFNDVAAAKAAAQANYEQSVRDIINPDFLDRAERAEAAVGKLRAYICRLTSAGDKFAAFMPLSDLEAKSLHLSEYLEWEKVKQDSFHTLAEIGETDDK